MAFDAYDEYEQGERVQQWLRQNGASIAIGITLGLVGIFGLQQWRSHQAAHRQAAAQLYSQVQAADPQQADRLTDQLEHDYAESPYAVFAASERAGRALEAGKPEQALASLQWAAAHVGDNPLKPLISLRIAKAQLAAGKAADALTTLDQAPAKGYDAIRQELRGDALVKLGRVDEARKAYQAALAATDEEVSPGQHAALQLKLDDLAVAGKQGA